MSMEAIRQLNSGGLKLKTNFTAKSVAANISANRSVIASRYSIFGSNSMFTPANRMGGTPKYASSSMISRGINRQSMSYVGGDIPVSSASYSQNVTMGTSSAFNAGNAIGMILGAAPSILGALNQIGVFGSNDKTSNKQNLDSISDLSNTAATLSGNADIQGLLSDLKVTSGTDSATLRNAIGKANGKLTEMQGQTPQIQAEAQQADGMKEEIAGMVETASKEVQDASTKLGEAKQSVEGAKDGVTKAKSQLSQAMKDKGITNQAYIDARTERVSAETHKKSADAKYTTAKDNTKSALNDKNIAKANLDKTPKTTGNPPVPNPEYAAAERAYKEAELKYNEAQKAEEAAKKEAEQADQALKKAETKESEAHDKLDDAEKAVADSKDAFKEQEEGLKNSQKLLDKAKTNKEKCESDKKVAEAKQKDVVDYAEKINDTAGKLQTHLKDIETLQKAVTDAQAKLPKVAAKEAKESNRLGQKITNNTNENKELEKKYDFFDNKTSKSERKAFEKRNANLEENQSLKKQKIQVDNNVSDSKFVSSMSTSGYQKGTNNETGNTFYLKDGVAISEEAYKKGTGES